MPASVKISGISKSYQKGTPVLLPLDLEIGKGELFFLLGPSGCGKSTLLRILAGIVEPDSGSIFFDDRDITSLPPEKRQAAMVFQNYALWPHLPVFENVPFGLRAAAVPKKVIDEKVAESLALVRMSDFADRRVPSLSGGQQQRIALARAIAVDPQVLLLDEPLSNLDAKLRDEMRSEIARICRERSLTAIYVTHDRREALSMGDRIALLDRGAIQQTGSPVELYKKPRSRFAASFLGDVNLLEGVVDGEENAMLRIRSEIGVLYSSHVELKKRRTLLIRPENISVNSTAPSANRFEAEYLSGTFLGERCELKFRTENGRILEVNEDSSELREAGKRYTLSVLPQNIILLED